MTARTRSILTGLRLTSCRVRVRVTLRLTVYRQSVHLGDKPLETHDQYFFQPNTGGYSPYVKCREDGSVVYNCCWSSPAQLFSGQNLAGLMTTFYCLRFETPQPWRGRSPYFYPPGTGWPGYTPRHWVSLTSFWVWVLCYDRRSVGQSVLE
jgi:hypothetical protein